jgi:hypothetical protein
MTSMVRCSEPSVDSKRCQYEHEHVDDSPHKGYPRAHLKVASLIDASEPTLISSLRVSPAPGTTYSPPTIAPLIKASMAPNMAKKIGAIHISFQLRHWMMHAHDATIRCMPPTSNRVQ